MSSAGAGPREDALASSAKRRLLALCLLLAAIASVPRFVHLGELGFRGDEELTAFAARSLAEGEFPHVPSGMEYRRGLPFTALAAATASLAGLDEELGYRVPAALLGALTVPLLFLFGRRLMGTPAALVAALLLALSAWHIGFSRYARMYAPFLFFLVLSAYGFWAWAENRRPSSWLVGIGAGAVGATIHALGLVAAGLPLVPVAVPGWNRLRPTLPLVTTGGLGVVAYGFARWVAEPYGGFTAPPRAQAGSGGGVGAAIGALSPFPLAIGLVGAGLGLWAGVRCDAGGADRPGDLLRRAALVLVAGAAGALASLGQLYGAALCVAIFLLAHPGRRRALLRSAAVPLAAVALLGLGQVGVAAVEAGVAESLRAASSYPWRYAYLLLLQFAPAMAVFAATVAWLAARPPRPAERGVRGAALVALGILVAVGTAQRGAHSRYLFPLYPFLLIVIAHGLTAGATALARRVGGRLRRPAVAGGALAALLVLSGALGGHGVPQAVHIATAEHGEPIDEYAHMFPFPPDHRSAGRWVARHRSAGDIVVAEDPLTQRWYAGPIDVWFRRLGDARRFLGVRDDGAWRDIYVDSRWIDLPALDSAVAEPGRAWLITSGETAPKLEWYLSDAQRGWLDSLARVREPAFTAEDGVTRVYCLDCPRSSSGRGGTP